MLTIYRVTITFAAFSVYTAKAWSISMSAGRSTTSSSLQPTLQTKSPTLGGDTLRQKVIEAARHDVAQTVDLEGIAWLEHINLVVGSKPHAEYFYQDFLGLTRDPNAKFHVNLGQQQFHLAETGEPPQRIAGSVGVVVPSLDTLRDRIDAASEALEGTQFAILEDDDEKGCMTLSCPWGNRFHVYDARDDDTVESTCESTQKMVTFHAEGGAYGTHRLSVRGNPGIRYVEVTCRPGTTAAIANFYRNLIGCTVSTTRSGEAVVCVGPGVHLIYVENDELTEDDERAMEGVHICVYAHDFKGLYRRLEEQNLIWTNPRFTHLDSCDTWEEALASRTLRFKDIVDLETGQKIFELEHETRPLRHGQYLKVPKYEPK